MDWEEKGGDIAVNTLRLLGRAGLDARLTVVGAVPPDVPAGMNITVIPFLDKNHDEDNARFHRLFAEADFFLLPTRAECAGLSFCEASAFGVPSITTDTGGTGGHVEDEVNGLRLPPGDRGEGYAQGILDIWNDEKRFAALRKSSREKYEKDLNWSVWGGRVNTVIEKVLQRR